MSNKLVVDLTDIDPESMDKIFDVMNFLSNHDELISKFRPEVLNFLEKKPVDSSFNKAFDMAFEDFVLGLIKKELVDHFNYTPEEVLILTDKEFISILTDNVYFNKENYATEGSDEHKDTLQ